MDVHQPLEVTLDPVRRSRQRSHQSGGHEHPGRDRKDPAGPAHDASSNERALNVAAATTTRSTVTTSTDHGHGERP